MTYSTIELLESRIAPAVVAISQFIDQDGDAVTIKVTTAGGDSAALQTALETARSLELVGDGLQLTKLDLTAAIFKGANVSIVAKPGAEGDGYVAVGFIDATGNELGNVSIDGDLGRIISGNGVNSVAVKNLTVQSIGAYGTLTQGNVGDVDSLLNGSAGKIVIKEDVLTASLTTTGDVASLTVGGNLVGRNETHGLVAIGGDVGAVNIRGSFYSVGEGKSGKLTIGGDAKSITIGGSVLGSDAVSTEMTGQIHVIGTTGKLTIMGNLAGGRNAFDAGLSQVTLVGDVGAIEVRGSVFGFSRFGNAGFGSGRIDVAGNVNTVKVVGSMIGSGVALSGSIEVGGLKTFWMGGNLIGGEGGDAGMLKIDAGATESITIGGSLIGGQVKVFGDLVKRVTVGGSIISQDVQGSCGILGDAFGTRFEKITIGGSIESSEESATGSNIRAESIGSLLIKGDITTGRVGAGTGTEIRVQEDIGKITVLGGIYGNPENTGKILAGSMGSLLVKKDCRYAEIAVGDGSSQLKSVTVNGAWDSSRFAMGGDSGADALNGTADDGPIFGTGAIAKLIIKGQVSGTVGSTDSYRIYAPTIQSATIGGVKYAFGAGAQNFNLGITGDVTIEDIT